MTISARLLVLSLAASPCLVTSAQAATIQVQAGTLTIAQAAGESTIFRLQQGYQEPPGTWHVRRDGSGRPGGRPTPGPGCAYSAYDILNIRCSGVGRVDIAFGDGTDSLFMQSVEAPQVPIRVSGGGGGDYLYVATPPGNVTIDGGAGNDTITTGSATVLGGDGDDAIGLAWVPNDDAAPVIDCGPGNDRFADGATLPASMRPTVDAATCPPVLRALGRFRRATNGFFSTPSFRVPASRRLALAVFRAAEPVSGTMRFRGGGGKSCAKPTAFHVAAGQQVRVTLSVFPGVVRRLAAGRVRQVACSVLVTGTDDEGEPISNGSPYTSFVLTR